MPIDVHANVVLERDRFGRFAAACSDAARRTVEKTIKEGAKRSRELAPRGRASGRHKGEAPLHRTIRWKMTTRTAGIWYAGSRHGLFVEKGTSSHPITGKLTFYWDGGYFYWDNPRYGPIETAGPNEFANWSEADGVAWVRHPGTNARPFLRPAYEEVVRGQMMRIAKREFPG